MKIYMVGVGGIGMSALAQLYISDGHIVSGSDREKSPTTELLDKKSVKVFIKQESGNVPQDAELVVYSDAVWEDNPERIKAKELGIRQISYFEALGEASKDRYTIAVSGTHGKTTTTAMLADILKDAGKNPSAIVGSIVREFGSNYLDGRKDLLVVEACEYKDHVLKLSPNILVITNLEWDHTDWFPSLEALQGMFAKAVSKVPGDGIIIANPSDPKVAPALIGAKAKIIDYTKVDVPQLMMIGEFNRMNARAAKAAARAAAPDISEKIIDTSLSTFGGTWRRFEYKGKTASGAELYDDYAHHPTAIQETLKAAKERFKDSKLIVAFHPHLYSRTRDLMEEFANSFTGADEVIIAPIYAAREEPIPGITSQALAEKVSTHGIPARGFETLQDVEAYLRTKAAAGVTIITMGAGDIYKVAENLRNT